MLSELDESIRQILIHEGGFAPSEVDVSFEIPNREWSGGISRPTLNCYLFDIHERRALRDEGLRLQGRGTREAFQARPPLFFDLTYLVTAWTRAVEDEHRLLWHVLQTLVRFPALPKQHLQGQLSEYEWPLYTSVAQLEGVLKSPGEFWTALENQLKPSLTFVVTLGLDREVMPAGPPVLSSGIRVKLPEATAADGFTLRQLFRLDPSAPLGGVVVRIEGSDGEAVADNDGHFTLSGVQPGRYVLTATVGGSSQRCEVVVRDAGYGRSVPFRDVVTDQDGQPVAGVLVEVEGLGLSATTDATGSFSLTLPPGRYTLALHGEGWSQRREVSVRDQAYEGVRFYLGRALINTGQRPPNQ